MSSLRSKQQILQHFTHIHPLTKVEGFGGFICNGCKTYDSGVTYRCASCNYDLHEYCATCPPTLLSFMHPQHELRLVFKEPAKTDQDRRGCNICQELAEGLYYHCAACGFDMHPLCSQLPQKVSHVPHPAHPLELSHQGASNMCMVCQGAIRSWRYKCGPCRLDVHMECVNSSVSATRGVQQKSLPPQPYFQPSQYQQTQQAYFHPPQYQQTQPYFQPSQYYHQPQQHQPYFQPSQYQQPRPYYHNHGHNYGYTNQGQPQGQQSVLSTGRKMFNILMVLTVGVVSELIGDTAAGALSGWFDTGFGDLSGSFETDSGAPSGSFDMGRPLTNVTCHIMFYFPFLYVIFFILSLQ